MHLQTLFLTLALTLPHLISSTPLSSSITSISNTDSQVQLLSPRHPPKPTIKALKILVITSSVTSTQSLAIYGNGKFPDKKQAALNKKLGGTIGTGPPPTSCFWKENGPLYMNEDYDWQLLVRGEGRDMQTVRGVVKEFFGMEPPVSR